MGSSPDTVLLTRPAPAAARTAAALGPSVKTLVSPLTEIRFQQAAFETAQAVLFTSANGAAGAVASGLSTNLPAYCVGPATMDRARAAGLDAHSADGTARELAELVRSTLSPNGGALIHARGAEADSTVRDLLTEAGFTVQDAVVYHAVPLPLSADALAALKAGRIAVAPVYSPRGARLLTAAFDDRWSLSSTHAVAISAAAADPLSQLPFRSVTVAARPDGTAMIDAIIDRLSEISRCTAP
ncbi:MAG: uroporphyrinogen-III synthase [Pseudomonadota bacterium]